MDEKTHSLEHDLNALEIILLKHFYNYTGLSQMEVCKLVATEYLEHLQLKGGSYVPDRFRNTVIIDLMEEVNGMIDKKITGFASIGAYLEENDSEVQSHREECDKKYLDLF